MRAQRLWRALTCCHASASVRRDGGWQVEQRQRLGPPRPVPPSRWLLVPQDADEDGFVGAGADLEVSTLVGAYRTGVFPWPHRDQPLLWFSPDPRAVIELGSVHVSRSLRRTLRGSGWTTTMDVALPDVMRACAERPAGTGTWITEEMQDAYTELGALGWVHSLEVWDHGELVGGLYGVQVGGVFTAESMFHRRTGASKVALVDLCERLAEAGADFLDVQLPTEHLRSMGASTLPRPRFLERLELARDRTCLPVCEEMAVARLA
jgi:leucyl/phenylalanyl-tRNA---protein transferase